MTEAEERLVRIDPGYGDREHGVAADAFLLPDSLQFAEYNAESPAGPGYTQRLCELFDALEPMSALPRSVRRASPSRPSRRCSRRCSTSYRDWGGTASPPRVAIVDWREVPTWSEFELLRDAFTRAGVPTVVARSARSDVRRARSCAPRIAPIDLVYRRVLINDIVARPDECRGAGRTPTSGGPSASPTRCGARCRTRRRSSPC